MESGDLEAACKTFKRVTKLQPTDPSVAVAFSDVLLVSQKYQQCIKYSEAAHKKFPGQPSLLLNQIRCHLFLGALEVAAGLLATVG